MRIKKGQQATKQIGELSKPEQKFVDQLLKQKPNLQIFRTKDGAGLGDFIIVDPSNPKNPRAIAVEAKTKSGAPHAGIQLKNAIGFMRRADFKRVDTFTGTLDEFLIYFAK